MENNEYIEDYFSRLQTDAEKQLFDARIINDAAFAEEVAFYIKATAVLKEQAVQERKEHFRELYKQQQEDTKVVQMPVKRLWKYMAAASVAVVIITTAWLFTGSASTQQLADKYISEKIPKLGVSMGDGDDSLQRARDMYNRGEMAQALKLFEIILARDSTNATVLKEAGITALRLADFAIASRHFERLAADTTLKANQGKLYQALTLMKRNEAGDNENVKQLLKQIIDGNLDGKKQAEEWLKKME